MKTILETESETTQQYCMCKPKQIIFLLCAAIMWKPGKSLFANLISFFQVSLTVAKHTISLRRLISLRSSLSFDLASSTCLQKNKHNNTVMNLQQQKTFEIYNCPMFTPVSAIYIYTVDFGLLGACA